MTDKPHNNLFEFLFSQKIIVKELIQNLLTDLRKKVDLRTLLIDNTSYIDERLDGFYSDIVFNVYTKGEKNIKIALLFEHKSSVPPFPHLQLMDYMRGIWKQNTLEETGGLKRKLTNVVPIIFYHGKTRWVKKPFHAYFDVVDEEFHKFIPKFEYYLIDLANYSDEFILSLKASFLINALLAFKHNKDTEYVRTHFARIFIHLEKRTNDPLARNLISHIAVYLVKTTTLKSQEIINLVDKLPTTTKKVIMTGYENLLLEGEKRGVKIGLQKGKKIGLQEGEKIGLQKGEKIGLQKGLQKGTKRAEQYKTIEISLRLLKSEMTNEFIREISEIPITTLSLLRLNHAEQFKNEALQLLLAEHLIQQYTYLTNEDIVEFTQLNSPKIEAMRK